MCPYSHAANSHARLSTTLPRLARAICDSSQKFKKGVSEGGKDDAKASESRPKPTDKVTMTQAELDALLSEREAQARKESPSN